MKGFIDMATCITLESGHTLKGFEKMFSFSIQTPRRTYFLLSKKEADMREWVNKICETCGFAATSSVSPATIREKVQHYGNSEGESGADGDYNDAFEDSRRVAPGMPSDPNYYKSDIPSDPRMAVAGRPNYSINLPGNFKTNCNVAPYESLGDASPVDEYGRERVYNEGGFSAEYGDGTYSRVNNMTYAAIVGSGTSYSSPPKSSPRDRNDCYGRLGDEVYGSTNEPNGAEYNYSEDYAYGATYASTNNAPMLKQSLMHQKAVSNCEFERCFLWKLKSV